MNKVRLLVLLAASLASAIGAAQEAGDKSQAPAPIPESKTDSPTPAKPASCCGKAESPEAKQTDQAQTDQAQADQAPELSVLQVPSASESGEPRDVAFEQFVDLEMLADAWLEMKASELLDCALQFRHAEQTLKREHKLISSRELLDYAARAATAKQDQPTLARLARVAEMIKDPQLANIVKLGAESRAAEADEPAISVDDLSPAGFSLVKKVVEGVENATTDGNPAGLDELAKVVEESDDLPTAQKEVLAGKIASARESLPEDGKNFASIMEQLTGASRAVTAATAKYIYDRMLTPQERQGIRDSAIRQAFNTAQDLMRAGLAPPGGTSPVTLPPGLAGRPPLRPGEPIPPEILNWWNTDPVARAAPASVDLNVNGARVTYLVAPGGDPQGLPLVDYHPNSPTFVPPAATPLQRVPSIIRPGLNSNFDPTSGIVIGLPDPGRLPPPTITMPPMPPLRLIGGLPRFISGSGPTRVSFPIFSGPFGPVMGPPVPLPPTATLLPLPTSGPLPALPPLPPPPPIPTTLVTTTLPPPVGPPPAGPPPVGPPLTCDDVVGTWYEQFPGAAPGDPNTRSIFVFTGGPATPLQGLFQMYVEEEGSPGRWTRQAGSEVEGTYIVTQGTPLCNIQVVDAGGAPFMDIQATFLGFTKQNGINVTLLQGDRTIMGSPGPMANLIR